MKSDFFFSLAELASLFCVLVASLMHAHLVCISVYVSTSKPEKKEMILSFLPLSVVFSDSSHHFAVDTLIDARLHINHFSLQYV